MRNLTTILAFILTTANAPVPAHGPTPQKVIATITIAAKPSEVWNRLKAFDRIADWHPLATESTGDGRNTPGKSERTLRLKDGGQITEGLDDFDAEHLTLSYRLAKENVQAFPVSFYSAILQIKPGADGTSVVEWKSRLYRGDTGNFPPPHLSDEAAVEAMKRFFETGLKGLKESVEKAR